MSTDQAQNVHEDESPEDRYRRLLSSHIGFVKRSCWLFDQGHEDEALRIATSLRVIFHDTQSSTSLLTHLGMAADPQTLVLGTPHPRASDPMWWGDFFTVNVDPRGPVPISVNPVLTVYDFTAAPVPHWWAGQAIFTHDGDVRARRDIVLAMANKDGGAHVDSALTAFYTALQEHSDGMGISIGEGGKTQFPRNAHLAIMRAFGHEVLATATAFAWPVDDKPLVPWSARYPTPGNFELKPSQPG